MVRFLLISLLIILSSLLAFSDRASNIAALTGARTRVVWCQDTEAGSTDIFALGNKLKLMGLDTHDGLGERSILRRVSNYAKPLITPTGSNIVFSNIAQKKVYALNWDGTDLREIADGLALEVWKDPETDIEWVYIGTDEREMKGIVYQTVKRHQIANPSIRELVWNKAPVSADNFQISADGTRAGAMFPWPNCGVAVLPNNLWQKYAKGCWTALSPDNSYILWIFDGIHRNIYLYADNAKQLWKVNISNVPGIANYEVYHPRWSNHVRFLTITGPYKTGEGTNRIRAGGDDIEIYLGRFNPAFTKIEKWVKISNNNRGDFYPDAWIEFGERVTAKFEGQILPVEKKEFASKWPGSFDGLVFLWENCAEENQIEIPGEDTVRICRIVPRGEARFGRYFDMDIRAGAFNTEDINAELLKACKKSNELTIEALITPATLDQDGLARIISFSTSPLSRNFAVGQDGENLVFGLRTQKTGMNGIKPEVVMCKLKQGVSHHIVISYKPGCFTCYLNGTSISNLPAINGDFGNWSPQHLLFGDEWTGEYGWTGKLEGIAIYNCFVSSEDACKFYSLYRKRLTKRKPVERLIVKAKLLNKIPAPAPAFIVPYRRALVVYTYGIEKIISGRCSNRKIAVAHWAILDGKVLTLPQDKEGQCYSLMLEKFDDHPQLQGERLITYSDEFDLPLFYDVCQ